MSDGIEYIVCTMKGEGEIAEKVGNKSTCDLSMKLKWVKLE